MALPAPAGAGSDTEATPLLPDAHRGLSSLPSLQLFVLCLARGTESWISLGLVGYVPGSQMRCTMRV
jgi:hypothetical protein